EAVARHDRQRRTENEEAPSFVEHGERLLDTRTGDVLPEEHHVRFEDPAAVEAVHDSEAIFQVFWQLGVAVGSGGNAPVPEPGVGRLQPILQFSTAPDVAAIEADGAGEVPVQFQHPSRTGRRVEAVDVLGHYPEDRASLL